MIIVTIDGGAASGKSSTARGVADRLNLVHVDTGSHYRALTRYGLAAGVDPDDPESVGRFLSGIRLETRIEGRRALISVNGDRPAESDLRSPEVNGGVSRFAACPNLRSILLGYQRGIPGHVDSRGFRGVVVEGRDIGSVVFPDAPFRFFLEADEATREARRSAQGESDSIRSRDACDSSRATAPLTCPDGARRIDTSDLDLGSVIDLICSSIEPTRSTP